MKKLTLNFFDTFMSWNSIYWIWCDKRQNSRVCLPWRHFWIAHASFWHGSLLLLDIPPTNLPLYSIMLLINPTASLQAPQSCHDEIKLVYIEDLGSTVHSASFWTLMISGIFLRYWADIVLDLTDSGIFLRYWANIFLQFLLMGIILSGGYYSKEPKSVTSYNQLTFFHAEIFNQSEVKVSFQLASDWKKSAWKNVNKLKRSHFWAFCCKG